MFGFHMIINCYNRTSRNVCLMYLNDDHNEIIYERVLNPHMHFELNIIDYKDYPWICFDVKRRSQLLINGKMRYHFVEDYENGYPLIRQMCYVTLVKNIYITLPVLSLLQRSMEIIMDNIKSKDDVKFLPIPENLKELLEKVLSSHD